MPAAMRSRLSGAIGGAGHVGAGQARHPVGDREQHLDAPRHDGERQRFEAERHRDERQQAERHDDRRDERRGEQVAEQRIGRDPLEMVGGEGRGREAGDQRGERDAEQRARRRSAASAQARAARRRPSAQRRRARARPPSRRSAPRRRANDIWKPGSTTLSGSSASTMKAAMARLRMEIAGRSTRIAANMIDRHDIGAHGRRAAARQSEIER